MTKKNEIIYNFSAGPAMIPTEVLCQAQNELCNWNNLGKSVMEVSHRSQEFIFIIEEMKNDLRILLNIPENYKILFCHGGARGQFSAVPMNLINDYNVNIVSADYANSGYWSYNAALEAKKYCTPNIFNVLKTINKKKCVISMKDWKLNSKSSYLHYCPNETIDGIAIYEEPNFNNEKIVVGDFSSTILSRVININQYDLIYASSQKNFGTSGITLIIIRENVLQNSKCYLPSILDYRILIKSNSMFNTPNTFSLYLSSLVLKWIKSLGGIKKIEKKNVKKSQLLYNAIDSTDFYVNDIADSNRSQMNIPFTIVDTKLHEIFLKESHKNGLHSLKGHNVSGNIRASIYNAMPIEGVKKLADFMNQFEKKYG